MTDSIDSALNRSANGAVFLGAAVKHLGATRRNDAQILADLMVASIDRIVAAATVTIAPNTAAVSDAVLKDLGDQLQRQAEAIAHVAVEVMTNVYSTALLMGARARENITD